MAATTELCSGEIYALCKRYLRDRDESHVGKFEVLNYKLKPTSDAPAGFLGRHQYLCVHIQYKDEADDNRWRVQKLHFFAKSAPVDMPSRMDYLEEFGVFKKEMLVYSKLLPELQGIFAPIAAKCYHGGSNILIFEDLARQNYKMATGRDGLLNYEHMHCALKTLAVLHAASIVYEQRRGQTIPEIHPDAVRENAYPLGIDKQHVRLQNFTRATDVALEIIKTLPKYSRKLDHVLREFPRQMIKIFTLAQTSTTNLNVFSHGDLWANNVMFKYGTFGDSPIECRYVDFQLARYASPLIDVLTILTIPTSQAFRKRHLKELLTDYYIFLKEFLKRENIALDSFMTEPQFWAAVQEYRIVGLIESCLFSHMTLLPPQLTQRLTSSADGFTDFFAQKRVEICMEAFRTDQIYRERMTDMIEDLVDRFVLPTAGNGHAPSHSNGKAKQA